MRSLASITGIRRRANSRPRERDQNQAAANTHPETVTVEVGSDLIFGHNKNQV